MFVRAGSVSTAAISPGGEGAGHGLEVVELDGDGGGGGIDGRGHVARARPGGAVGPGHDERLVDAAVVAVGEDQDLGPAGDQAGQPQRPPVGVGGAQGERPLAGPKRRVSSAATHSASSLGSMAVMPPRVSIRRAPPR